MAKYAQYTKVPVAQSRSEIEHLLSRYGADQFGTASDTTEGLAMIQFRYAMRMIRFKLSIPGTMNDQQLRQHWRALVLAIKSKLESVECGIETFEEAFLAHVVMPDGQTFGKFAIPAIEQATKDGRMPQTLIEFQPRAES